MNTDLSRSVLVQVLAGMPDLRARTLSQHVADDEGFCVSCRSGQRRAPWPCRSWMIGRAAERLTEVDDGHAGSWFEPDGPRHHQLRER